VNLDRWITNKANWVLDNCIPPILRDNTIFMGLWFWLLFGNKSKYFMEFKKNAPFLSQEEYEAYYQMLSDRHIQRKTDLTHECIEMILSNIVGKSALDVGCGRGYLVNKIAAEKKIKVVGIDISAPEKQNSVVGVSFIKQNIEELPFQDKSFDTVICTHTIEHLLNPLKAIVEIRRVARKRVIIIVPRQREYRYTFDLHIHFFPYIFSLQKLMKNKNAVCCIIRNDIYYKEDIN
jgi:SAM-dependent methyltransferase